MSPGARPTKATPKDGNRGSCLGCGLLILALLVVAGIGAVGRHLTSGPETITMPNFAGKDCKASQAEVDQLIWQREGVYQDDSMAGDSPSICTGSVVIRTDPPAGATVNLAASDLIPVHWWAIEPAAYKWYKTHRKMPNYVGKNLDSDPGLYDANDANDATYGYVSEDMDFSLVEVPAGASGWYEQAAHKIVRTNPAPGGRLSIGQQITIFTQVQRGQWVSASDGSSSGGSSNGDGLHVGVCVGTWILHVCS